MSLYVSLIWASTLITYSGWGQNDFLQWCLDEGKETSIRHLAQRILGFNFVSLHVSDFPLGTVSSDLNVHVQTSPIVRSSIVCST